MIKAVVIDDEPLARKNLSLILKQNFSSEIIVIDEADTIDKAKGLIHFSKPDLVFLDIELGGRSGFDLLRLFEQPTFKTVFITAYSEHALEAIRFQAFDYLMKPLDISELTAAIDKYKASFFRENKDVKSLKSAFGKNAGKLAVPTQHGFTFLSVENIMYLRADKDYTYIYCIDNHKVCSSYNLGYYENNISEVDFFRVHHSYIVNRKYISEYIKGEGGEVVLASGIVLPVSRRRKSELLSWLTG